MTETPPPGESYNPPQPEPPVVPVERKPPIEKRPVSVRARETANTGYQAVRWIVLLVLLATAAIFIIRNFERVPVDWVFRASEIPLSVIMIIFLIIGFLVGWLAHWFSDRPRRR